MRKLETTEPWVQHLLSALVAEAGLKSSRSDSRTYFFLLAEELDSFADSPAAPEAGRWRALPWRFQMRKLAFTVT